MDDGASLHRESLVAALENTPASLRLLLERAEGVQRRGPAGEWSAFDVVGHLIDGEETDWIPRARIILSQAPVRRFEPFDRERHLTRNAGRSILDLLDEFARLRRANLAELRGWNLRADQLPWTGEHPDFGSVTLRQLLATWVVHDLGHVAQAARALAQVWGPEVGPWRAYLPVLEPRRAS